ncbi:NnrU family protein [Methylopila sp. Yamaguchi]|uniref:NnrU family protein n=1 Tax=Methylopila sp. Yamaguchi TaxID=1437817 RepID=UPI000CBCFA00|nr:NnrU family protein [Methylopila sp. Yamaguchi]GBD48581.1 NnrU family protein [Methylopila sp. Yamaguchi]
MAILAFGLALFLGTHLFTRAAGLRAALVARLGETGYKGLYSLASAVGLAAIIYGYSHAPAVALWSPPGWTRHIPITLMWPAFVLLLAAYLPGKIRERAKHPMLAAVKLWAFSHLCANGDLPSVLLFGGFLAYGVIARILLKRHERAHGAPARRGSWQNDVVAVALGTVLYALFGAFLHAVLIGVPAFIL